MVNIIIIALLVSLAKSICYEHKTLMINGSDIIPERNTFGWIKFQPYNLSNKIIDKEYECATVEYYFKNVTCEFYDHHDTIYFVHKSTNNSRWEWLHCRKECNITVDCNTTMSYLILDPSQRFEYEIIINQEKIEKDCILNIIVIILVSIAFVVAITSISITIYLITIYLIAQMKKNTSDDKTENFYLRISKLFF